MKVGIISDIHGNMYALNTVLKEAAKEGVEKLIVLGDIVGYYYEPKKVLDNIRKWDFYFIKGNHEEILKDIVLGRRLQNEIRIKYGSGHDKALEQFTKDEIDFLTGAPDTLSIKVEGLTVFACHGSPWQSDFYLYPDSPQGVLNKCEVAGVDIVFVGHSHRPFIYKAGETLLVNVGSVGQSRSTGGLACWAVLNSGNGSIELKSTPYDVRSLIEDVQRIDPQVAYMKDILIRNRLDLNV